VKRSTLVILAGIVVGFLLIMALNFCIRVGMALGSSVG
jgi:hypothetical protein